jgi:DNA/RNA endonuclease YhcR with UshA esterase domain
MMQATVHLKILPRTSGYMGGKIESIMKGRFFLITVVLATAGVLMLYVYAIQFGPSEVPIGEIDGSMMGQVVTTSGIVSEVRSGQSLTIELLDVEAPSSILVYVPGELHQSLTLMPDIRPGAELRVKGEVGEYNGDLEILVRSASDIAIISSSEKVDVSLETLAKSPELFRDLNVSIEGIVVSIEAFVSGGKPGTTILLKDGKYEIGCIAYGSDLTQTVTPSSEMTFEGTFEYREEKLGWFLVRRE